MVPRVLLEGSTRRKPRRLRLQPRGDLDKARRRQSGFGLCGGGVVLGVGPVVAHLRQGGSHAADVAGAAALCRQLGAGTHHGGQVAEHPVMVHDPMEGGGTEDRVDTLVDGKRVDQVGEDEVNPPRVGRQAFRRLVEHRPRRVQRDRAARGYALQQAFGDTSAAAAGVKNGLVAAQLQPLEHHPAPPRHRVGDAVVGLGVPLLARLHALP